MKTKEERQAIKDLNLNSKIGYCLAIQKLQERLKNIDKIKKANKNDDAVQQYQGGRETELRYAITLLLTPKQRLFYAKSKDAKKYLMNSNLAKIENRINPNQISSFN